MRSLVALAVTLMATIATASKGWDAPKFCNGLNCPEFTTLQQCNGFEIRKYKDAQWVGSEYTYPGPSDWSKFTSEGFNKGFKYISGANVASEKIDMTCPVLTKIVPGAGPNCNTTFTESFYVPYKYLSLIHI